MIKIYTDASVTKDKKACGACLVLTDDSYMGYNVFELRPMKPVWAELKTCIYSIEYALRLCPDWDDDVTLYCDNESVVSMVNTECYAGRYKNDRDSLIKLLKDKHVKLVYIKGHSVSTNPNVAVDGMARAFFRRK